MALLLAISITSVIYALISLCVVVLVIYLILWVFGKLGIEIPANIAKVIWVILVLLAILFILNHFFWGTPGPGIDIKR